MQTITITWFEIPVSDLSRAQSFYETVFSIKMSEMELANGLKMALFPAEDGKESPGSLNFHPDFYKPGRQGPLIYLNAGNDMESILNNIVKAGGQILVPKTRINENMGSMSVFIDSEGNKIALNGK